MATVTEVDPGRLTIGRIFISIATVIAGSVTIGVTAFGADAILRKFFPGVFATGGDTNARILLLILFYTALFSALGGYVTAWLANRAPMKHVFALGILQTIGAVAAVIQAGDALPRWYAAAVVLFPIPVILLGGSFKSRVKQVSTS